MPIQSRRRATLSVLVATLILTATAHPAHAADPNEFIVWSKTNLPGRMYVPANYDPAVSYPFILFYHGFGERGTNNVAQVDGNIDGLLAAAKQYNAFLYAPQSNSGNWGSTATTPTADIQNSIAMMRTAQNTYHIDPKRLYLTGLSAGGGGAWDTLGSYPATFAAAMPICGTLGQSVYRDTLDDENILTFHARNDSVVPVTTTRNMVNAILIGDGRPTFTFPPLTATEDAYFVSESLQYYEFATGDHGIWNWVYNEPLVYDWLFAQSLPEPGGLAVTVAASIGAILKRSRRAHCGLGVLPEHLR
jgi:predicted peptidase